MLLSALPLPACLCPAGEYVDEDEGADLPDEGEELPDDEEPMPEDDE